MSSSPTDPTANSGLLPEGLVTLYLWLQCATFGGIAGAEFDIQVAGAEYVELIPVAGSLNAGTKESPFIALPFCPANFVLAEIVILNTTVGVVAQSWSGVKAFYR